MNPETTAFFDEATNTISYVAADPATSKCAVIDSVLDYDPNSGHTDKHSANQIIDFVHRKGLEVEWVLETHVHADHLSAAPYIKQELGGTLAIGSEIVTVQNVFGKIFNAGTEFQRDGSQFDVLFKDGDAFRVSRATESSRPMADSRKATPSSARRSVSSDSTMPPARAVRSECRRPDSRRSGSTAAAGTAAPRGRHQEGEKLMEDREIVQKLRSEKRPRG